MKLGKLSSIAIGVVIALSSVMPAEANVLKSLKQDTVSSQQHQGQVHHSASDSLLAFKHRSFRRGRRSNRGFRRRSRGFGRRSRRGFRRNFRHSSRGDFHHGGRRVRVRHHNHNIYRRY